MDASCAAWVGGLDERESNTQREREWCVVGVWGCGGWGGVVWVRERERRGWECVVWGVVGEGWTSEKSNTQRERARCVCGVWGGGAGRAREQYTERREGVLGVVVGGVCEREMCCVCVCVCVGWGGWTERWRAMRANAERERLCVCGMCVGWGGLDEWESSTQRESVCESVCVGCVCEKWGMGRLKQELWFKATVRVFLVC